MNVLMINGSPKGERSNTRRLAAAFAEGLKAADRSLAVETLNVSDLSVAPCLGCYACWKKTPGVCCQKDDMAAVLEKMTAADILLWSFPLYISSFPGPMKTLLDRSLPLDQPFMRRDAAFGGHPERVDRSAQRTVLISTCGFWTAEGNYDAVTATFDRVCGPGRYETLFCGQGELFAVPELAERTGAYLETVRRAGTEFARGGITAETRAALAAPLLPRETFETLADASWGVREDGTREEESLLFTRQMAALYDPAAWPGHDLTLDMDYTDRGTRYRVTMTKAGASVSESPQGPCSLTVHTPLTVWKDIAAGKISGAKAMMKRLYRAEGDLTLLFRWDKLFGGLKRK